MNNVFDKLIEYFLQFPGIGPRQAKRFAYFLAGKDEKFLKSFAELILEINKEIKQCNSCYRFYQGRAEECNICSSLNRDRNLLMIVEKDFDLENIERAGVYNGKYFILGGTIPLINNGKGAQLRFKELFEKAKKEKPGEIILALSATAEGENTARYTEKILEPLSASWRIKTTRLGRGLSTGTELEYSDSQTISDALKNRK